jgi:hypothetical protein
MSYTRITVPLSREELNALRDAADREYRHPRDQARYLVRQALGLADKPPDAGKHNGAGTALGSSTGAAVTTLQAPSKY